MHSSLSLYKCGSWSFEGYIHYTASCSRVWKYLLSVDNSKVIHAVFMNQLFTPSFRDQTSDISSPFPLVSHFWPQRKLFPMLGHHCLWLMWPKLGTNSGNNYGASPDYSWSSTFSNLVWKLRRHASFHLTKQNIHDSRTSPFPGWLLPQFSYHCASFLCTIGLLNTNSSSISLIYQC